MNELRDTAVMIKSFSPEMVEPYRDNVNIFLTQVFKNSLSIRKNRMRDDYHETLKRGVHFVSYNGIDRIAYIIYDPTLIDPHGIVDYLKDIGIKAHIKK